jgi:hypothetical protein
MTSIPYWATHIDSDGNFWTIGDLPKVPPSTPPSPPVPSYFWSSYKTKVKWLLTYLKSGNNDHSVAYRAYWVNTASDFADNHFKYCLEIYINGRAFVGLEGRDEIKWFPDKETAGFSELCELLCERDSSFINLAKLNAYADVARLGLTNYSESVLINVRGGTHV